LYVTLSAMAQANPPNPAKRAQRAKQIAPAPNIALNAWPETVSFWKILETLDAS
jgi:hypothetical protein